MAFEVLLMLMALVIGIFFIGIPAFKLFRTLFPPKRDPLKEARERLQQAQLEAQAAKLNKEAEKVYTNLYRETLEDDTDSEIQKQDRRL